MILKNAHKHTKMTEELSKFEIKSVGIIQVPNDFHWVNWMMEFIETHHIKTHFDIPETIVAKEPTHYVFAGDKIKVNVVRQTAENATTWNRFTYLREKNSLLLGTLGAALALEFLFDELPAGMDIYSFDYPNNLRKKIRDDSREEAKSKFPPTPERLLPKIYKGVCETPFFYFEEPVFRGESVWNKESMFFHFDYVKS